ncbi:MAG: response regulator [Acidobacteria bacterium]|nr:response regulator [Acidobacteriota bacterium]MCA1651675.1 response regulator [Acidobacteriota bacterium]
MTAALNHISVVVVDDDADTLRLLTLVLQRAGATVMAADSAEQAFKRVCVTPPDVLLTDIEMPGEDGYELLDRVRRLADVRARRLPAIAFTAHGSPADAECAARAGFTLHNPKPIRPSLLVARVAALAHTAKPMHECFA